MRKKTLLIAAVITAVIGLGLFIFSAVAAPEFLPLRQAGFKAMMSQEWRDSMQNAIQDENYDSWRNLMQERHNKMLEWMTPERFSKMNEMHQLMREGNVEDANKIRQELGMPEWSGKKSGKGMMGGKFSGKAGGGGWCWR